MKTIGLIGGMSWESSLEYYRIVNESVKKKLGGLHSAKCVMYSVDFDEIETLQREGRQACAGRRGRFRGHLHQHHAQDGRGC
jgi:aspartate racemase